MRDLRLAGSDGRLRDVLVFAAIWLFLMVAGRSAFLNDPGTFWHVAAGTRMLDEGRVLREDPFGFVTFGRPWAPMQWLAEIGMAVLYRAGGLDALVVASAALLALVYAALARHLLRRGCHPWLTAALVIVTLASSAHHFLARPHLVTLALVGWTFIALQTWEEGDRRRNLRFFTLPAVFACWSNLHGGVLGGWMMLSGAAVGWELEHVTGWRLSSARERGCVVAVVLSSTAACVVSPFGLDLPRIWWTLSSSSVLRSVIQEHTGPTLSLRYLGFVLLGSLYLAMWAGVPTRAQRVTFAIPAIWLLLGFRSVRHEPLFALTSMLALPAMMKDCTWLSRRLAGDSIFRLRSVPPEKTGPVLGWIAAATLVLSLSLQHTGRSIPVLGRGWALPSAAIAPFDLLPSLQKEAERLPDRSGILNEMEQGGFLMLHVPALRVFIDDRWELYGDETFARYERARNRDPADLDAWAGGLGIVLALASRDSPLEQYLATSSGWSCLARGAATTLYHRAP
jgi:hypothetical protein